MHFHCHVPHGSGPCLPARGGSGAVTCPTSLRGSRALRIKKCLAATAYNKACVFSRHIRTLPRRLQDVQSDDVIMTYKPCRQTL
jgi:hypothetical protein